MSRRTNSTAVLVATAVIALGGALVAAKYWHPPGGVTAPAGGNVSTDPGKGPAATHDADGHPPTGLAGELFVGHDRGLAKTSIAKADVVAYANLKALLASLPSDDAMHHHHPALTEDHDCDRVEEERRNVKVVAWIYAVKHEDDHDFHVILGSSAVEGECEFMTSEVTGLPAAGPDLATLTVARGEMIGILGEGLIEKAHQKYEHPKPPIRVEVQGSLFYDVDHPAGAIGPAGEKPRTAWEIHPVTEVRQVS